MLAQLRICAHYREVYGLEAFERRDDPLELAIQAVYQPTCTICGLNSGYQGEGSKTVLPAEASAKVDFRLYPTSDLSRCSHSFENTSTRMDFPISKSFYLGGNPGAKTDPDHPAVGLAVRAAEDVYDKPTRINPMIGGSA